LGFLFTVDGVMAKKPERAELNPGWHEWTEMEGELLSCGVKVLFPERMN
jgi:hypothetical protein